MPIFVIDGGKRYFKFRTHNYQSKIPSLVGPYQPLTLHENNQEGLEVSIESTNPNLKGHYYVGNLALEVKSTYSVSKDYCLTTDHKILLLTSLALMSSPISTAKIISSLQINDYKKYREQYISEYLNKTFTVLINNKPSIITITNFEVFPQGGADIFSLPKDILLSKKTGIINIGYRDINLCVVNWTSTHPKYESSLSCSFNSGIYEAELNIIKNINQTYNTDLSIENLDDFIQRKSYNPSSEYQSHALKISKRIKQVWQNLPDLDQIFISGGGGILLHKYLISEFPNLQLLPIQDPQFGNVEGMWNVALERFGK